MSEEAQGKTKILCRLGELAGMHVHHGHASALSPRRQQENGTRLQSTPQLAEDLQSTR